MSKYNLIHLKSLQKNSNFTVYECSIRDLIFERVNNSILRSLNKYFLFPIYIFFKSFGYDLIHISDQGNAYLNIFIPKKTIITCHDMILIKKKNQSLKEMIYSNLNLLGLYFSKKIVAVSKSTKKDLLNFFPSSKIKVIYTPVKEKKLKIKKIKKTKKFLLHLGSIFYKNRIMALKIFNEISKKKLNYVLRCTGKLNKEEKSFLENKKISDKVEVFNNISEIKKKKLFQTSDILLVTSSDEGYGFPLLEAYNLDLPVLTSNKGSLKEISNGFSVIKKYTVDSFVKKILLLDKNNSYKKQIIKNNKKILKKINDLNEYKLFYRKIYIDTIKA